MIDDVTSRSAIADAAHRLGATIRPVTLGLPVAACPGWSLERLVGHTGRVHRWVTGKLLDPGSAVRRSDDITDHPPEGPTIATWFEVGATALIDALATVDLDAEADTWAGRRPTRFWLRRMLQETTVHAWDAEATVGTPQAIDAAIALDGIDEVLEVILPLRFDVAGFGGTGETIHLHATDEGLPEGAGEWLLTVGAERVEVAREHAKGDVAVRGPASSLLLLMWGRPAGSPSDDLSIFGQRPILDRYAAAAHF